MIKKSSKVINLGCRLNFSEAEVIKNILSKNHLQKKIVVNTCAVTNQAVQKSIYEINKVAKTHPDYEIIVTGCASQVDKTRFLNLKNVRRIVDNRYKTQLFSYKKINGIKNAKYRFPDVSEYSTSRTRATLQIQQGCNHRCTFCIIPFGRGDAVSLPIGEISNRIKKIVEMGYREITFTGVDLTSFGEDLPGKPKLGSMLRRLLSIHPNLMRVRLSSVDPAEIDEDLMYLFKYEKRLMPHLHLSLQSGDNLILKRMKRRHSREQVLEICKKIKLTRPEMTFGSDVIVGFPTENEKNFNNTIDLIEDCNFSNVHIFPFSPKKGTPASKMPQVDENLKIQRVKKIRKTSRKILSNLMKKKIGRKVEILFESNKKSYTDDYYKVSLIGEKAQLNMKKAIGSVISVRVVSKKNDRLMAEI